MKKKAQSPLWVVRMGRSHPRLWTSVAVGLVVFGVLNWLQQPSNLAARILIGWDIGVLLYIAAAAVMMARSTRNDISRHSAMQDEGAFGVLLLVSCAAMASLAAIFIELAGIDQKAGNYGMHVALAIGTVVLSWVMIQTIFALHYAYDFYGDDDCAGGLKFPGSEQPDYWDFVYFAFVVGMTFQVSDVAITNRWIRRLVTIHGVLAFFYTTAVVALMVNLAAGAVQR